MTTYQAPQRDMQFVMDEVLDFQSHYKNLPGCEDVTLELISAIRTEGAKFTESVLAPLYQSGDEEGCKWQDGDVTTPAGFKEAYQKFREAGWPTLTQPLEYGGQGLPTTIGTMFTEMVSAANMPWSLINATNSGTLETLHTWGSSAQKDIYMPKIVSGEWSGTMCLTEPHCGTDLGMLRTKAEPDSEGGYLLSGTKIFISEGEHDKTDNIIHIVLARLPDAPAGVKGISLFIVPKFLVNEDGTLGERNTLSCGSIEHKMGIKASATCVMNFDGAKGWLVGGENKGLNAMFTMMNYERVAVGIQGVGIAENSYQNAVTYANDRIQSRAPTGKQFPEKAADPIIVHPDVRRMLLTMRALTEGGRAFSTYASKWLDISKFSDNSEDKKLAEAMVSLLTPVVKSFLTDTALESTVAGQQVFGGHGFIREWGQEQHVRDVRITQIYEGTNGIQSLDLIGRKIAANGGAFFKLYVEEINAFIATQEGNEKMAEFINPLKAAVANLVDLTEWVMDKAQSDANEIGASSVEFLQVFGYTSFSYMFAMSSVVALEKEGSEPFYANKLATARFFTKRLLPRYISLSEAVKGGAECLFEMDADQF